jgi:hypothetical protein
MAKTSRDTIPLGVAGLVTISREQYRKVVGRTPDKANVLFTEDERIAYIARRLTQVIDRPLTAPGSGALTRAVLAKFGELDLMPLFAEKALETLVDGKYHNRVGISRSDPPFAISFIAWSGTHREVQSQRLWKLFKFSLRQCAQTSGARHSTRWVLGNGCLCER